MQYTATPEDHAAGTLPAEILRELREAIGTDGFAVVGNLVSEETRDLLLPSILEDADTVRAGGELTPHEQHTGVGHLQLGLRRYAPYVCADLVANPLIESVVEAVLGDGAWLGFYNGNVNCPGSTYQPLHFDRPFSWKTREEAENHGQSWPPPATTLSCSVALADITIETGATEIYPGSQRETEVATWTTNRLRDRPDLIEAWVLLEEWKYLQGLSVFAIHACGIVVCPISPIGRVSCSELPIIRHLPITGADGWCMTPQRKSWNSFPMIQH